MKRPEPSYYHWINILGTRETASDDEIAELAQKLYTDDDLLRDGIEILSPNPSKGENKS